MTRRTPAILHAALLLAPLTLAGCGETGPADPVSKALRPFVQPPGPPRHRVLVIGWDGATFNQIDPLLRDGKLPNLRQLVADGVNLNLESTVIPISSAAWVAAVTGVGPGKSGVFGFFARKPGSYEPVLVNSRDRRVPAVWNIAAHYGLKTHLVSVPITYPPEDVPGVNFGCMLAPFDADYAHPPGLTTALRKLGFEPDLDAWQQVRPLTTERIEADHRTRTTILRSLVVDSDWDLILANYKSLDVLAHRLYTGTSFDPVALHYARLDDALGQLRTAAGPQTDVLVLSDHGFGMYTHQLSVHGVLADLGLLAIRDTRRRPPPAANQNLAQTFAMMAMQDLGALDFPRTSVFCDSTEGHFAALRLNLAGREPNGVVPAGMADATIGVILEQLLAYRLPDSDRPVFVRAWRTSELYPGPANGDLPEILLEADRKFLCRPYFGRPTAIALPTSLPEHERGGVLFAAGPSFRRIAERGSASILDVTPTLLQLFGLPAWEEMDGTPLLGLLVQARPIARIEGASLGIRPHWSQDAAADPSADVIQRLMQLGYVGGADDDSATASQPASRHAPP